MYKTNTKNLTKRLRATFFAVAKLDEQNYIRSDREKANTAIVILGKKQFQCVLKKNF